MSTDTKKNETVPVEKHVKNKEQKQLSQASDANKWNIYDIPILLCILATTMIYKSEIPFLSIFNNDSIKQKNEISRALGAFKEKSFYLGPVGPLAPFLFCDSINNDNIFPPIFACITYLISRFNTLKSSSMNVPLSIVVSLIVSALPLNSTIDVYSWGLLLIIVICRVNIRSSRLLSINWFINLTLMAIFIGLSASIKLIGFATLLWVSVSLIVEWWFVRLCDLKISNIKLFLSSLMTTIVLFLIPTTIFFKSYDFMLSNYWINDNSNDSLFVPLELKSFLRTSSFYHNNQPQEVYYGSVIQLRHVDSLSGYLASMPDTFYPEEPEEQFVGLTYDEYSDLTHWIIEHENPQFNKHLSTTTLTPIQDSDNIKIRHIATGKLLRVSGAKPPISDEDYTKMVSCTRNWDFDGEGDEIWTIINESTDIQNDPIQPNKDMISVISQGQDCSLIGHDIRIDNWGKEWQEVLCLDEANEARTKFQITVIGNHLFNVTELEFPIVESDIFNEEDSELIIRMKLVYQYLRSSYKYNWYILNKTGKNNEVDKEEDNGDAHKNVYLMDKHSPIFWLMKTPITTTFITLFIIFMGFKILSIFGNLNNILENKNKGNNNNTWFLGSASFDYFIAWFIHFYIFTYSPHLNVSIIQYVPAFIFGLLLISSIF